MLASARTSPGSWIYSIMFFMDGLSNIQQASGLPWTGTAANEHDQSRDECHGGQLRRRPGSKPKRHPNQLLPPETVAGGGSTRSNVSGNVSPNSTLAVNFEHDLLSGRQERIMPTRRRQHRIQLLASSRMHLVRQLQSKEQSQRQPNSGSVSGSTLPRSSPQFHRPPTFRCIALIVRCHRRGNVPGAQARCCRRPGQPTPALPE